MDEKAAVSSRQVIVALGGPNWGESQQRAWVASDEFEERNAAYLIMAGGVSAFDRQADTKPPMGKLMASYAIRSRHIPEHYVVATGWGRDTVGDALATKTALHGTRYRRIGLVTTASHLDRSHRIFEHVMGPAYDVETIDAGPYPQRLLQPVHEAVGNVLARAVFAGTEPGDDQAITQRLIELVPGYTAAGKLAIGANHVRNVLGRPLVSFSPQEAQPTHE